MRLDADHQRGPRVRFALALALSAVVGGAACSKTWVLAPDPGAGGAGAAIGSAGGAGGSPGPAGSGGLPGFGGRGDSGSGGNHGGGSCSTAHSVPSSPLTAEMVFVVARNASMSMGFDNTTRMTAVQVAVHNAVFGEQTFVNFGYQGFPSFTGCQDSSMCCASSDDGLDAQPGAISAIDKVLYRPCDQSQSGGGTGCVAATDSRAVSQTLSSITSRFGPSADSSSDRYVVLLTDGPPGCPGEDPKQACGAAQGVVSTLSSMSHGGIKTFVVDVGETFPNDPCLDQLAGAGKAMPAFYVSDPASLANTLNQITNVAAITSCTVVIPGGGDPDSLQVYVGGKEVHYEMAGNNGWNVVSGGPQSSLRIQLHGSACLFSLSFRDPSIVVFSGCPPCSMPSNTCL